jgi:hypothetical protein
MQADKHSLLAFAGLRDELRDSYLLSNTPPGLQSKNDSSSWQHSGETNAKKML